MAGCPSRALAIAFVPLTACGPEILDEPLEGAEDGVVACSRSVLEGIDISHAQGDIDWRSVASSGVTFALMKATQGTRHVDTRFDDNWAESRARGLVRGAYHFFDPTVDGAAQARHLLDTIGRLEEGDLPPIVDVECPDGNPRCLGSRSGAAPASQIADRLERFVETIESELGATPILYTTRSYFSRNGVDATPFGRCPLWIASLQSSNCVNLPRPWAQAAFQQYTWRGRVPGISGAVDRDWFRGTRADLAALAALASRRPPSDPDPDPEPDPDPDPPPPPPMTVRDTLFAPPESWIIYTSPADGVLAGDFDGDGDGDLTLIDRGGGGVLRLAGAGGRGFRVWVQLVPRVARAERFAAGDVDANGATELLMTAGGDLWIVRRGANAFETPAVWLGGVGSPVWLASGDFDGDGRSDAAWLSGSSILVSRSLGDRSGAIERWIEAPAVPEWAAAADLDGDGMDDLAWYAGRSLRVLRSHGTGFTDAGVTGPLAPPDLGAVGDVDGDRRADVLWSRDGTWLRSAGGGFERRLHGAVRQGAAALGDFDRDGALDLSVLTPEGSVLVASGRRD